MRVEETEPDVNRARNRELERVTFFKVFTSAFFDRVWSSVPIDGFEKHLSIILNGFKINFVEDKYQMQTVKVKCRSEKPPRISVGGRFPNLGFVNSSLTFNSLTQREKRVRECHDVLYLNLLRPFFSISPIKLSIFRHLAKSDLTYRELLRKM